MELKILVKIKEKLKMKNQIKNALLFLSMVLFLSACCPKVVKPEPQIITVTKVEYKKVPSELLDEVEIPPLPDSNAATQKDVASWIISVEKQTQELRNKLKAIKEYNSKN